MHHTDLQFFPPANGRVHEVCGAGAYVFALALAARLGGPFMWIREDWEASQINPNGVSEFVNPARLTVCQTKTQSQTLAAAEEALRSGAVSLIIMTIGKPIGLTQGRRLQLAARDGNATGLVLIPEGMGSNTAEIRWRCMPVFDAGPNLRDSTLQKWELIKNKTGTLGVWHVRWDTASRRLTVVSPAGE